MRAGRGPNRRVSKTPKAQGHPWEDLEKVGKGGAKRGGGFLNNGIYAMHTVFSLQWSEQVIGVSKDLVDRLGFMQVLVSIYMYLQVTIQSGKGSTLFNRVLFDTHYR